MARGIPNKPVSSDDVKVGQFKPLEMPVSGSLENLLRPDLEVEVVDGPSIGDLAAQLAFNEEYLDVIVHESTDKNAAQLVDLYCNGTPQRFFRGKVQRVKRKYVNILASARETSVSTTVSTQGGDGEVVNRIDKHTAVRYPFSVVNDPNPRGADWLRKVLASA